MVANWRIAIVLLGALQSMAASSLAQTSGGDPDQDGANERYRVEILVFAYNGFDPDEEIFPEEPFEIRLDTRPPGFLIRTAPRPYELLEPLASADVDQASVPQSSVEIAVTAGTQEPDFSVPTPDVVEHDPDNPAAPGHEPLGPADDGTLSSLLHDSASAGEEASLARDQYRIRTAYVQRLIASLQSLEDPSKVPVVFEPIPEIPPLAGLDEDELNLAAGVTTGPDTTGEGESEPVSGSPLPAFRLLRTDELELRGAVQRLRRDTEYRPLAHGGWVQATYPPDQAVPIDIALLGTVNPVGTVKLHLSRFLHVTVDLVYRAPPVPANLQATTTLDNTLSDLVLPRRYAFRIQRRVRSGEVHYLDHPAIGLLVIVRPQPVEPEDADDSLIPPRVPAA